MSLLNRHSVPKDMAEALFEVLVKPASSPCATSADSLGNKSYGVAKRAD